MNIEQHCITLEQALKINNLIRGDRDSLFCYCRPIDRNPNIVHEPLLVYRDDKSIPDNTEVVCSAYTASELGEMIGADIQMPFFQYYSHPDKYMWKYLKPETMNNDKVVTECTNEAQDRAALLIHLLENKIITL